MKLKNMVLYFLCVKPVFLEPTSVAICHNNQYIVSGSRNKVTVYDFASRRIHCEFEKAEGTFFHSVFS